MWQQHGVTKHQAFLGSKLLLRLQLRLLRRLLVRLAPSALTQGDLIVLVDVLAAALAMNDWSADHGDKDGIVDNK